MTSLPVLSALQSKVKYIKGPTTINMPTNLSTLIENESSSSAGVTTASGATTNTTLAYSTQSNGQQSYDNVSSTTTNGNSWINCSEVPRQVLPSIPSAKNSNKAQLARQVTNVIKRHNLEARQQITDKII